MDLHPDFSELLHCCVENKVEFVVVGGYAIAVHTEPRFTADIDLFVRPDKANAIRLMAALELFGFSGVDWAHDEFERPDCTVMLGRKPLRIDILTGISGVSFDQAFDGRVYVEIDGKPIPFIGKTELVKNKRSAGRAKDIADLEQLEDTPASNEEPSP